MKISGFHLYLRICHPFWGARFVYDLDIDSGLGSHGPKFNSWPLKNDGWKTTFLLGRPIFRGNVELPGSKHSIP